MRDQILALYKNNGSRPGHMLLLMNFIASIGNEYKTNIKETLIDMINEGLIEQKEGKHPTMFFLTELGWDAIHT